MFKMLKYLSINFLNLGNSNLIFKFPGFVGAFDDGIFRFFLFRVKL